MSISKSREGHWPPALPLPTPMVVLFAPGNEIIHRNCYERKQFNRRTIEEQSRAVELSQKVAGTTQSLSSFPDITNLGKYQQTIEAISRELFARYGQASSANAHTTVSDGSRWANQQLITTFQPGTSTGVLPTTTAADAVMLLSAVDNNCRNRQSEAYDENTADIGRVKATDNLLRGRVSLGGGRSATDRVRSRDEVDEENVPEIGTPTGYS